VNNKNTSIKFLFYIQKNSSSLDFLIITILLSPPISNNIPPNPPPKYAAAWI